MTFEVCLRLGRTGVCGSGLTSPMLMLVICRDFRVLGRAPPSDRAAKTRLIWAMAND